MQRRKHLSVSALCFCGAGHVWKSGLIRAESKSPHVTLMYIYVFRLFLYLGCWQNFGDWEDGGPIGVRLGSPAGLWLVCGVAVGRGCEITAASLSLRRSIRHLEQPYPGIRPLSIERWHPPPTHPGVRSLFPDTYPLFGVAVVALWAASPEGGCCAPERRTVRFCQWKHGGTKPKPGRMVMDWADPTSERFLGPDGSCDTSGPGASGSRLQLQSRLKSRAHHRGFGVFVFFF